LFSGLLAVPTYRIRSASLDDLDDVLALRQEAERWLRERGVEQWTDSWSEHARKLITDNVAASKTFVVQPDGGNQVVATVTLNGPCLDFWTEDDDLGAATYLYKLIVAREASGTGLGDAILNWASQRAHQDGRRWLRIDVWRDNERLQAYYLKRGFEHVRTVYRDWRKSGALFQRTAGSTTSAGDVELVDSAD